ncbi:MAG: response regulator [Nodosilinea sp.]
MLVVDDDADNLVLVNYVLEQFDCLLYCETEGKAALNLIWKLQPDLIVLDIRLPGMSGLEITQIVRRHPATSAIPIIAVTALATSRDQAEIILAGCNHYLPKPYLIDDIRRLIGRYITARP